MRTEGKQIPLRFSLWALRRACTTLGITLEEFLLRLDGAQNGALPILEAADMFAETIKEAANHEIDDDAVPYETRHIYKYMDQVGMHSPHFKEIVIELVSAVVWLGYGKTLEEAEAAGKKLLAETAPKDLQKKRPTTGRK